MTNRVVIPFFVGFILTGCQLTESWSFLGYKHKESADTGHEIIREDFKSEDYCANFGNAWLSKQNDPNAFFTCGLNCDTDEYGTVCNKICKYGKEGFISCRD